MSVSRTKKDLLFEDFNFNAFGIEVIALTDSVVIDPSDVARLLKAEGTKTLEPCNDGVIYCDPETDTIEFIDSTDSDSLTVSYSEFLQYLALIQWIPSKGL